MDENICDCEDNHVELLTGLLFEVEFGEKITATNYLLNLDYEYDPSYYGNANCNAEDIDEKSIVIKFDHRELPYDALTITGKTLCNTLCNTSRSKSGDTGTPFEYNLRLQNSAIPFFINDSVDELYHSLVETKIEAYIKEKEQQSIINALNAELASLRSNLIKST